MTKFDPHPPLFQSRVGEKFRPPTSSLDPPPTFGQFEHCIGPMLPHCLHYVSSCNGKSVQDISREGCYRFQISVHVLFCRRSLESRGKCTNRISIGSTNPNFV